MMLNKVFSTTFFNLLFICFLATSCGDGIHETGNGTITDETRNVGAFFELDIEGNYDIVLQEGTNPLITIETDENLHQYIETTIDGKTLRIRNVENIAPTERNRIIITYQKIEGIKLGGAAKVSNRGVLNAGELPVRVDGAAVIDLNVRAESLSVKLSGAAAVNLQGEVGKQEVELSGAGNYAAYGLQSKDCEVDLSGIGGVQVFVTDNLQAEVSGVGTIRFKGDPRNISREVSGTGDIERSTEE